MMNKNYTFKMVAEKESAAIVLLLQILDERIPKEILTARLKDMFKNGFYCAGLYFEERLVGICGVWILYKYYVGKHLELDNVIIHPKHRNKKLGEQLVEWAHQFGKENGCTASELNCYVQNSPGHKFWLNQGYKMLGIHYQKKLDTD